jgi:uncharacterized membrane protein YgcG
VAQISVHPAGRGMRFISRTFFIMFCFVYITLLFLGGASTADCREIPSYKGYVNDYASMISPEVQAKLESYLQSFDLSDSTQVAILTIF